MKSVKNLVLLVNLGSPDNLSTKAIYKFLSKFLGDYRVIGLPRLIWLPILYFLILPLRVRRLLKQYQSIWLTNNVSPLVYYTKCQSEKLALLASENTIVDYAFSYTSSSVSSKQINNLLNTFHEKYTIQKLLVIPLYPQFSSTTTLAVFDQIHKFYSNKLYLPNLYIIGSFAKDDRYIKALCTTIKESWSKNGKAEKLILSYHSLPLSLIHQGDSYYKECLDTSELIVQELNLKSSDYVITFQSKFGSQKWITPATKQTLINLAKSGIKKVDIICPGFVSDCLETLEEIAILNKNLFLASGGVKYNYIECLNDNELFIQVLDRFMHKFIDSA